MCSVEHMGLIKSPYADPWEVNWADLHWHKASGLNGSTREFCKFFLDFFPPGILGVNGSGKTTLLRTLVGELACLSGEVYQQPRTLVHLGLSQYDLLYTHTYIYILIYIYVWFVRLHNILQYYDYHVAFIGSSKQKRLGRWPGRSIVNYISSIASCPSDSPEKADTLCGTSRD